MKHLIIMPDLGQTTNEGTIRQFLRQAGDRISRGEPILAVSTDKVELEVESFASGYLREWLVEEGAAASALSPIAVVTDTLEESYEVPLNDRKSESVPAAHVALNTPQSDSSNLAAVPAARRLAREKGIDLSKVLASGAAGMITKQDVSKFIASLEKPFAPATGFSSRAVMAATVTASKREIPHFYVTVDVSMTHAAEWRTEWNLHHPELHVTYNDLFVMCASRSLRQTPILRVAYRDGKYEQRPSADILLTVAQEPAIALIPLRDPSQLTWDAFLKSVRRATQMIVTGDAEPLLAISNLGMFGVKEFAAIVPPSCTAILAVGAVREKVTVKNGAVGTEMVCSLTLSADHRVVDGVTAARFLERIRSHLDSL
jgi:pyruvate dehydrogenase E2 component (dihydrolipoamide acetyltransferase)